MYNINRRIVGALMAAIYLSCISSIEGFAGMHQRMELSKNKNLDLTAFSRSPGMVLNMSDLNSDDPLEADEVQVKDRLEAKMAEWENMPAEESKGVMDGFDIGLWIMFPFIVATSLLFFVFPFIMDKIDVSSVGPPPTV